MSVNTFCQSLSPMLQLIGQGLSIFKLLLPLVLIALGIIDIGRAVVSSKSDDVKKNMKNFAKKIAACIVVFFIPTICMVVFGFVGDFNSIRTDSGIDFDVCFDCIFNPANETCSKAVEIANADEME